ncbi:metal-binding protein [Synechococcus sp. M16.1]|uniref:metal-binding protein n=1 Tax=Synechococcus sp. M16.1 TaxID=1442553 RepID=UPI00351C4DF1
MGAHDSPEDLATGRHHDQSIWVLSLPLGIAVGLVLGWAAALIAAASCLAGGLWLSPDLDTRSNALRRWGVLGFLWWPYRLLIPHRSLWSHGPLLGTTARMAVLLAWCLIVSMAVPTLSPAVLLTTLQQLMHQHPQEFIALLVGFEGSAWIHLILDGDPWPQEWSKKRQR